MFTYLPTSTYLCQPTYTYIIAADPGAGIIIVYYNLLFFHFNNYGIRASCCLVETRQMRRTKCYTH